MSLDLRLRRASLERRTAELPEELSQRILDMVHAPLETQRLRKAQLQRHVRMLGDLAELGVVPSVTQSRQFWRLRE